VFLLELVDRGLREEFGRLFAAGGAAMERLHRARDRLEAASCVALAARAFAGEVAAAKSSPQRKTVDAALAYIESRWLGPINLDEVAAAVGLSRSHFSRLFRAEVGMTFTDYLCSKRIDRAKSLLADPTLPMKRVCDLAGFGDPAYFSSAFKKREGLNPSEYRALAEGRKAAKLLNRSHIDETRVLR
jgi:AraC-like DNA-binding protein